MKTRFLSASMQSISTQISFAKVQGLRGLTSKIKALDLHIIQCSTGTSKHFLSIGHKSAATPDDIIMFIWGKVDVITEISQYLKENLLLGKWKLQRTIKIVCLGDCKDNNFQEFIPCASNRQDWLHSWLRGFNKFSHIFKHRISYLYEMEYHQKFINRALLITTL